jgi:hypothetical protein
MSTILIRNRPLIIPEGFELKRVPSSNGRTRPHVVRHGVEYKYCSKCDTWRPLAQFYNSSKTRDKLQAHCKVCYKSTSHVYYKKSIVGV